MSVVSSMDESTILKPFTQIYESAIEAALYGFVQNMNTIIKAPQEAVDVISEVSYMVYRALALTDDVIDNSKFRKKVPTANEVFGAPRCLNASWISFFMAIEKLLSLKQPKAVELLVKNIKMMYIGQAMEIVSREAFECPTEEECDEMAFKKTGGFLLHITELLQLFAQDQRDLTKLNKLLGIFYGAHDDLEDLHTTHIESYSEDTNDGKFGFPLVIAINRHPRKLDKCEIAAGMADKASRWSYIQTLLKESDALVRCQEILSELEAEIRTELDAVGGSDIADYLLSIRL